ncbi:MAG: 30S ribosomal protein S6 [Candidatus Omnitrophica bacterium]|nr:30S ribosomal protein S6 [Candidatus Omnitrophota bacterium]
MKKYEAMFILKPDLNEEAKKTLFAQIAEPVSKNGGTVTQASVWTDKKKLYFPLKKNHEGLYYLLNFTSPTQAITKINHTYTLNEDILRVLITVRE